MKSNLSSQYKAVFREELYPYGFKLYKKTFYRIIDDVVQTVMLLKTSTGFSIGFDISPLSLPIKDLFCEGYDLASVGKKGWWQCWDGIEENAFTEIVSLFRQYVKPIFERGVNARFAYDELIRYEKMIHTRIPGGVIMNNYRFVCLCIQIQNYKAAYAHMAAIVKQNIGAGDFNKYIAGIEEGSDIEKIEQCIIKFSLDVQENMTLLYRLSMPDIEYFQNFVAENEAISLEYLKYPGRKK